MNAEVLEQTDSNAFSFRINDREFCITTPNTTILHYQQCVTSRGSRREVQ